jgi:hypothetical protein
MAETLRKIILAFPLNRGTIYPMRSNAAPARSNVPRSSTCDDMRMPVVMQHDAEGRIFEVGAKTRTIPPAS